MDLGRLPCTALGYLHMTSPLPKTALLAPACTGVRSPSGVVYWSWARAQSARFPLLQQFERFVCLPAAFPRRSAMIEHCRGGMARAIAARVAGGALAVFCVPPWRPSRDGIDESWNKGAWVIEAVTGVRLRSLIAGTGLRAAPAPDCPPAFRGLLERARPTYELRVPADDFGEFLSHRVLGTVQTPDGALFAMAGFPGKGAWLIVPSDEAALPMDAGATAVGLLDVLDKMRPSAPQQSEKGKRRRHARPRAGTALSELLLELEASPAGQFILVRDRRAITRLRSKYDVQIESVADALERGVAVPSTAKGYRIVPRSEG